MPDPVWKAARGQDNAPCPTPADCRALLPGLRRRDSKECPGFLPLCGSMVRSDFERSRYPDWETVIKALVRHRNFPSSGEESGDCHDEFPTSSHAPATPSVFRRWMLSLEPVMLVISGSSVSTMETEVPKHKPALRQKDGAVATEPLLSLPSPVPPLRRGGSS